MKRPWIQRAAVVVAVALVAGLALMWPGYDVRHLPPEEASLWVLQTGEGKRYARVNTDLGELDTVKNVANPSSVAQHADQAAVFADGNQRYVPIAQAQPEELNDDDTAGFIDTPPDTISTVLAGEWVAHVTGNADTYRQHIGEEPVPTPVIPEPDDAPEDWVPPTPVALGVATSGALAVAVPEGGDLEVHTVDDDAAHPQVWSVSTTGTGDTALANVGGTWVLHDVEAGEVWAENMNQPILTGLPEGAILQQSSESGERVYLSDEAGLTSVQLDGEQQERVDQTQGTPAQPVEVQGVTYGAWISEAQGALWSSAEGVIELQFPGEELGESRQPAIVHNGTRAVVNEQYSGWVWSVPEGELLPSSTQWRVDERVPEVTQTASTEKVYDPKPPVAEPDHFGVRAGERTLLPVLLNDHDPNEDVLTVAPGSIEGLDPSFGEVSLTNAQQQLVVDVLPGASGTATFTYRASDGTTSDGLLSEPATVTLEIEPETNNDAPQWCGVEDCLATWPTLEVAPGGAQTVNVLEGWVDPEGDPIYLQGVEGDTPSGALITKPTGELTYRHTGQEQASGSATQVNVIVADAHGATSSKSIDLVVSEEPPLEVQPFAVTGATGIPLDIPVGDHVTGAVGGVSLETVAPLDDSGADLSLHRGGTTATVQSDDAGSYLLQVTVRDRDEEAIGLVRVDIVDPAEAPISVGPLTAFVRPGEDETVDVVHAASDPVGDVLLIDELDVESDDAASLDAQAVGQHLLRVSGTTDDGQPGLLGKANYRISDGRENATRITDAEITVVLLPESEAVAPIAVDDRVTVRAGAQVDIPVIENDTAPAGTRLQIDQSSVTNEHDAGLVFATPDQLRYLAPEEPGEYTLTYTVGLLGYPTLTSSASVRVTVTGEDDDYAPQAPPLEGRVVSGQTVRIPFETYAGEGQTDAARLDRITTQPKEGQAAVTDEGDAIEFSSNPGATGQVSFEYRVRDDQGDTALGEVRVGVLDTTSAPGPITYSDYVQVQLGAEHTVAVNPLDNDVDPTGGELTLTEVTPNAEPNTSEYDRLAERITSEDLEEGHIRLSGGETLGADSYMYTAENEYGDTSIGMIVVKTIREPVVSYPVVQDTILTAETIDDLERGVDVLSRKVTWNSGDHSDLEISLWGEHESFEVSGRKISGDVHDEAQLIPFEVTGTSFNGTEVQSYGFLRVPGLSELKPSLRSAYKEVEVDEEATLDVDLREAVRIPRGETLTVHEEDVHASDTRAEATCEIVKGTTLRYTAGPGAPWRDSCSVPVSYSDQDEPTVLHMRIKVNAVNPEPELRAGTLTVRPGKTQEYNLAHLIDWEHDTPRPQLTPEIAYNGELFDIEQRGDTLVVHAKDTARPSRSEAVTVSLAEFPDLDAKSLTLLVGRAPSALPRGATVAHECAHRGDTTECTFDVIGASGEVNPLPDTPLNLVSVSQPSNCEGVQFELSGERAVRASWRQGQAGAADCRASFVVEDAQGRVSAGDRNGKIIFDLQGKPANPTRVEWTGYGANSVQLRAVSERPSIPEVTGYRVRGAGKEVTCPASGVCDISGLETGAAHEFTVTAVNDVGTSPGEAQVTAWAYSAPAAPTSASWSPKAVGRDGGVAVVKVDGIHPSTAQLRVSGGKESFTVPVSGKQATIDVEVGNSPKDLRIVPATKYEVPPDSVGGGSSTGKELVVKGVHGVGAPGLDPQVKVDRHNLVVKSNATENGSSQIEYAYAIDGDSCRNWGNESSRVFEDVERNVAHTVTVCARHVHDHQRDFGTRSWTSEPVTISVPTPNEASYTIAKKPKRVSDTEWEWDKVTTDATPADGHFLQFKRGGKTATDLADLLKFNGPTGAITMQNCEERNSSTCSAEVSVNPTGAKVFPKVTIDKVADSDGVCTADNLETLVHVLPTSLANISEETKDNGDKYVEVSIPGLETITSETCTPDE